MGGTVAVTDGKVTAAAVLPVVMRGRLAAVAVLASLVVAGLGVRYAGDAGPGRTDARIGEAAYGVGAPWWHIANATDFLGDPGGALLLLTAGAAGCLRARRPRAAVLLLAGPGLAVGVTRLLKPLAARTINGDDNLAFPSGHTAFLTAFALALALLAAGRSGLGPTSGTALALAAASAAGALMGWAQVATGAHYPTDTVGGCCTALAVVPAAAWVIDRVADARRLPVR
ncbi:phosphatase PAP2 family protein [Streptomyces pseudogriseolus]|uniref:phosphatase PAP2 family protein n=1 Tax=Streptomyces pseudogriseolus TaxID=36817 RepID=UPI00348A654E|nr:phosphatase PAP2 family protein [Streptomyces pseudogriseolus]